MKLLWLGVCYLLQKIAQMSDDAQQVMLAQPLEAAQDDVTANEQDRRATMEQALGPAVSNEPGTLDGDQGAVTVGGGQASREIPVVLEATAGLQQGATMMASTSEQRGRQDAGNDFYQEQRP